MNTTTRFADTVTDAARERLGIDDPHVQLYAETALDVCASMRVEDTTLLRYTTSLRFEDHGTVVASAEVVVSTLSFPHDVETLIDVCDGEDGDLYGVVIRLATSDATDEYYYTATAVLNRVEVAEGVRGVGAGELVVAHALLASGGLRYGTLIAAVAGCRVRSATPALRSQITGAAARILTNAGLELHLTPAGEPVYVGDTHDGHLEDCVASILRR